MHSNSTESTVNINRRNLILQHNVSILYLSEFVRGLENGEYGRRDPPR
jgi:hypothetical protein